MHSKKFIYFDQTISRSITEAGQKQLVELLKELENMEYIYDRVEKSITTQ